MSIKCSFSTTVWGYILPTAPNTLLSLHFTLHNFCSPISCSMLFPWVCQNNSYHNNSFS
jgi:hypothetical protein